MHGFCVYSAAIIPPAPIDENDIDAEKEALRSLLDSFQAEPETLLERTINDPATRRTIGKVIGYTFVKPYIGER